jgi:hypothetical protein
MVGVNVAENETADDPQIKKPEARAFPEKVGTGFSSGNA